MNQLGRGQRIEFGGEWTIDGVISHTSAIKVQVACSDPFMAEILEKMMLRPNASRALLSCKSDPGFLWHEIRTVYIPSSSETAICWTKLSGHKLSNCPGESFPKFCSGKWMHIFSLLHSQSEDWWRDLTNMVALGALQADINMFLVFVTVVAAIFCSCTLTFTSCTCIHFLVLRLATINNARASFVHA